MGSDDFFRREMAEVERRLCKMTDQPLSIIHARHKDLLHGIYIKYFRRMGLIDEFEEYCDRFGIILKPYFYY